MDKEGLLIILSGPSGVGKGTVRMGLMKEKGLNLWFSISMTTRERRSGEKEGREYFYVTEEEFDEAIKNGDLLEHAGYVGHRYGTPKSKIEEKRKQGYNVLLEINVQGAKNVMKKIPDAISIFLVPPTFDELETRIRTRSTEDEEDIKKRMKKARLELEESSLYDYVVVNNVVEDTVKEISSIIQSRISNL